MVEKANTDRYIAPKIVHLKQTALGIMEEPTKFELVGFNFERTPGNPK